MFLLCTYLDGPYWRSGIEPLLYPTECSFYRPLSYRKDYISESLLNTLSDDHKMNSFLDSENENFGIFGVCFSKKDSPDFYKKFVPLRFVSITQIERGDNFHINFRLKDYINPLPNKEMISFSLEEIPELDKQLKLMIAPPLKSNLYQKINNLVNDENLHNKELPERLWRNLLNGKSISPKAKENIKGTTVLWLRGISERGNNDKLTVSPASSLSIFGEQKKDSYVYKMQSGKIYDLDLAYESIGIDPEPESFADAEFVASSPADYFETSLTKFSINGNYRYFKVWVLPKVGRPAPHTIDWIGSNKKTKKDEENENVAESNEYKLIGIHIPVLTYNTFFSFGKLAYFTFTILSLLISIWAFNQAFFIAQQPTTPPSPFINIYSGLGTFFAGVSGAFLQILVKTIIDDKSLSNKN